jgi:hypothetical protein
MAPILEKVELSAVTFPRNLQRAMSSAGKHIDFLRVRVISFRDFYTDPAAESLTTSGFFALPDNAEEFDSFVRRIHTGGGSSEGKLKTSLEALAAAIRSPWAKEGSRQRQVIVVWSDAGAYRLEKDAGSKPINYPQGMPSNLDELTEMWEGEEYMSATAKRLLLYIPEVYPWTDIANDWSRVVHIPSKAGEGLTDKEYTEILNYIVFSI